MKKYLLLPCICLLLSGCQQQIAKNFGGTLQVDLEPGERLENITWKKESLWLLTTKNPSKPPKTYTFKENSLLGVMEGTVIINEK